MNMQLKQNIPAILDKLCALFDAELERQLSVQRLCLAQGESARNSNLEEMQQHTEGLTILMDEALQAERVRIEVLHFVVEHFRLTSENHTLSDLIAVVPSPWNNRLRTFQVSIKSILTETQSIIEKYEGFMHRAAEQLEESIYSAVEHVAGVPDGYSPDGMESKGMRQPALLNTVG